MGGHVTSSVGHLTSIGGHLTTIGGHLTCIGGFLTSNGKHLRLEVYDPMFKLRLAHAVHDVYHLWEFIRDLLHDPKYCPRIIKWENADDGVFRVVDSQEVASLWGKTKKSTKMTYEYMSRSLRYCRTLGYFADLPKNAGYPKKLCFKFGPKAHSWKPKDSPKLDEPMNLVTRKGDSISEVW